LVCPRIPALQDGTVKKHEVLRSPRRRRERN
jgi:hypothetical protein